jgi:hypothetical protein
MGPFLAIAGIQWMQTMATQREIATIFFIYSYSSGFGYDF